MERRYISKVKLLSQYILQVDFVSDSRLLLDMKPYLEKFRFHSLADLQTWNSVVTTGIFIRFGNVELSHDEILAMARQLIRRPVMVSFQTSLVSGIWMEMRMQLQRC